MLEMFNEFAMSNMGRAGFAALALACLLVMAGVVSKKSDVITPKMLAYTAISLAMATVLSIFPKWPMPSGGSITLCSMLFIMLPGFWFGPAVGLIAGLTHGFIQLAIDPYIVHPVQVVLDYLLGFGCLGLAGFFWKMPPKYGMVLGAAVGCFGRFIASTISGVVFFAEYAGDMNVWVYSISYNGIYIAAELALIVVLCLTPIFRHAVQYVGKQAKRTQAA